MATGRRERTEREFSAGGLVVRDGDGAAGGHECIVIVPTRLAAGGEKVLTLPKGHPDDGESAEQAAAREVLEETGVEGRLVAHLHDVRYWYQRDGRRVRKIVAFYLFEHVSGDPERHVDDEVEVARWMTLEEASRKLTYPGDRKVVKVALTRLGGGDE